MGGIYRYIHSSRDWFGFSAEIQCFFGTVCNCYYKIKLYRGKGEGRIANVYSLQCMMNIIEFTVYYSASFSVLFLTHTPLHTFLLLQPFFPSGQYPFLSFLLSVYPLTPQLYFRTHKRLPFMVFQHIHGLPFMVFQHIHGLPFPISIFPFTP